MFIVDFDDTLFDTHAYKQKRLECVKECGVTEEQFWATYARARNDGTGAFTYSDQRHAEELAKEGYDYHVVFHALMRASDSEVVKNFLFPNAIKFLSYLQSTHQKRVLLSLGDAQFQKIKTEGTGVLPYFDEVFMVHDSKEHIVRNLLHEDTNDVVWFINDKVQETKELLSLFPHMNAVLKKSQSIPIKEYSESSIPCFDSLSEIVTYVSQSTPQYV